MIKLEKFEGLKFINFEKFEIGNLGQILGGKKNTQSGSTGWWCNDSNGTDDGPWVVRKKDVPN